MSNSINQATDVQCKHNDSNTQRQQRTAYSDSWYDSHSIDGITCLRVTTFTYKTTQFSVNTNSEQIEGRTLVWTSYYFVSSKLSLQPSRSHSTRNFILFSFVLFFLSNLGSAIYPLWCKLLWHTVWSYIMCGENRASVMHCGGWITHRQQTSRQTTMQIYLLVYHVYTKSALEIVSKLVFRKLFCI